MDSYQPIYDAVRSRISGGDVGSAVQAALRDANLNHYADMASRAAQEAANEASRPSVLMRPTISRDGNMWCALYGEDLVTGCAGFGPTPAEAMADFDANWADMQASAEPSIKSRLMGEFDRVILALKEAPNGAA
jgi:hypothetical protein